MTTATISGGVTAHGGGGGIISTRPSAAELVRTPEIIFGSRSSSLPNSRMASAIPNVDIQKIVIEGESMALDVREAVVGGDGITRTMDGASTIKFDVLDPYRKIMRSGIFEQGAEMEIDGLGFVLVGIDRQGDVVSLTWEDREISWLRGYDSPLKAWKDKVTRGWFIHFMIREVIEGTINFWCPEESEQLPVDAADAAALRRGVLANNGGTPAGGGSNTSTGGGRVRGLTGGGSHGITFKHSHPSAQELADYNTCMLECVRLRAGKAVMIDMTCAGIGESNFDRHAVEHIYWTHKGVFQSNVIPPSHVQEQAHYFLVGGRSFAAGGAIGFRRGNPGASHGACASHVEIGGPPSYYEQFVAEAIKDVDIWLAHAGVAHVGRKINIVPNITSAKPISATGTPDPFFKVPVPSTTAFVGLATQQARHGKKKKKKDPFAALTGGLLNGSAVNAFVDAGVNALGGTREVLPPARVKRLAFQRGFDGKKEDSWTCLKRLCSEKGVNWNPFMVNGWLYVVSDALLFSLAVQAVLNPNTPGVHEINYAVDTGKFVQEVTILAEADRWDLPPGSHVFLDQENDPAIFGDWLVKEINRPMFSTDATITLRRAKPLTFAAKDKSQNIKPGTTPTVGGGSTNPIAPGPNIGTGNQITDRVLAKAIQISNRNLPYKWGGGHGSFSDSGYDCSGYVSACLHNGGLLSSPEATGALVSWGKPGRGKFFTVWVKSGAGAHVDHCFIDFERHPHGIYRADTSPHGSGGSGPHVRRSPRDHSGFVPRHWPGC